MAIEISEYVRFVVNGFLGKVTTDHAEADTLEAVLSDS